MVAPTLTPIRYTLMLAAKPVGKVGTVFNRDSDGAAFLYLPDRESEEVTEHVGRLVARGLMFLLSSSGSYMLTDAGEYELRRNMTRGDRLADLIREAQDDWHAETGCGLDAESLTAYFGMDPAEYFAEQLDAEGYERAVAA